MTAPRIALATCAALPQLDPDDAPLLAALAARGVDARATVWDDPAVDWAGFDLVVVRSTWDYTERLPEFLSWAERVSQLTTLVNPVEVLRWNTDKRYLADLAAAGLPVVPSTFLDPQMHNEGRKIHARMPGRGQFVVKPAVSAGSKDTARYRSGDVDDRFNAVAHIRRILDTGRAAMIQPYLEAVDEVGETALVYVSGLFSHAVRKDAILTRFGDPFAETFMDEKMSPRDASHAEREVGDAVVAAIPKILGREDGGIPLLYVRIDLIPGEDGTPLVLEVEATEPSLFFRVASGTVERFADAVLGRAMASRAAAGS